VRALDAVCRGHDVPLAQAALQFPLAHPTVISVIAGAQTREEVSGNAAMADAPMPGMLWDDLKRKTLLAPGAPVPRNSAKVVQPC
jgi:D-threo-aldose 1-dehydrogenase